MINKKEILKENQIGVRFGHFIKSENKTINTFMQELAIKSEFYGLPLYEEILAYSSGRRTPTIKILLAVCNSFNVSLQSFFMNDGSFSCGSSLDHSKTLKESNFSSNLEKLLKENKVTQQMLANILGVSRITVNKYINGSTMPRVKRVFEISLVFEVVVDSLFV